MDRLPFKKEEQEARAADMPGNEIRRDECTTIADEAKPEFIDTLLKQHCYLYDKVNGTYAEPSVR